MNAKDIVIEWLKERSFDGLCLPEKGDGIMTPNEIIKGMQQKNLLLTQKNDKYLILSEKKAMAEKEYSIALAQTILKLKLDGNPVGMIDKVAKGDSVVAKLKYQLDIAEAVMKACKESMDNVRIAIDTYRSILTWQR